MAHPRNRRPQNVAGDFYVDTTCIDCDTCRWMAPETFERRDGLAAVHRQPRTAEDRERALLALVSCPTASIGTLEKHPVREVQQALPLHVAEDVYHCGFHSEASFGAASYFILRPEGNVLVDSPRFVRPLVRRLEELGGIRWMFLTHQDDVAEHERFREHFGCERVLHTDDARGSLSRVEMLLHGIEPHALDHDLLAIPTPGHTRGSACLLHRGFLFSGDHVAWDEEDERIRAFRSACWFDWDVQTESMRRLARHDFEWILPGHGRRCRFPAAEMRERLRETIEWMERQ